MFKVGFLPCVFRPALFYPHIPAQATPNTKWRTGSTPTIAAASNCRPPPPPPRKAAGAQPAHHALSPENCVPVRHPVTPYVRRRRGGWGLVGVSICGRSFRSRFVGLNRSFLRVHRWMPMPPPLHIAGLLEPVSSKSGSKCGGVSPCVTGSSNSLLDLSFIYSTDSVLHSAPRGVFTGNL